MFDTVYNKFAEFRGLPLFILPLPFPAADGAATWLRALLPEHALNPPVLAGLVLVSLSQSLPLPGGAEG